MGAWLRHYPTEGRPLLRLICLPHAGGSSAAFASWPDQLPPGVELIAVQYPGRQDRIREDPIESMDVMAETLVAELQHVCDLPIVLFGHSMGSAVAYEVALRFERDLGVPVHSVFVSARSAPHRRAGEPNHLLNDEDLIKELRLLGGIDDAVYDRPKLWPLILPPLRADLRLLDRYRPAEVLKLRAPIVAFGGEDDHTCTVEQLRAWNDATLHGTDVHLFPGGHHYLAENEVDVLAAIRRHLDVGVPSLSTKESWIGTERQEP